MVYDPAQKMRAAKANVTVCSPWPMNRSWLGAFSATSSSSTKPMICSSEVSLNRLMNWPTMAGITARRA